jgi:hypothetical protein
MKDRTLLATLVEDLLGIKVLRQLVTFRSFDN